MDKPVEVKLKEMEERIVNEINKANLQPFLIRPIFERIYNQIITLEQQAYAQQKEEYEKFLEKEKENEVNGMD